MSTVVLALSMGLNVIAYDAGALADVVHPSGLVRHGDEAAFAERICTVIDAPCGGPARSIDAWRQATLDAWLQAISNDLATAQAGDATVVKFEELVEMMVLAPIRFLNSKAQNADPQARHPPVAGLALSNASSKLVTVIRQLEPLLLADGLATLAENLNVTERNPW